MSKRILLSVFIIIFVVAASLGSTMAWFTAESEPVQNVFTAGTIEIESDETGEYSEDIGNWNPGDSGDKNVTVTVGGTKKIYLRAELTEEWTGLDQSLYVAPESELRSIDWSDGSYSIDRQTWWNGNPNKVEWFLNDAVWSDGYWEYLNGYWYYIIDPVADLNSNGALDPGEVATFLSSVRLKGLETGDEYQGAVYTMTVQFEAIQTTHEASFSAWDVGYIDNANVTGWFPVIEVAGVWTMDTGKGIYEWTPTVDGEPNHLGWNLQ